MLLLAGCETLSPNKASQITVDTFLALSSEVDLAEKRDWIDNDTEDRLQNRLIDGLKLLKSTYTLNSEVGCPDEVTKNDCLQLILLEVEARLREAGQ